MGKKVYIVLILILVISIVCLIGCYFYLKLGHEKSEIIRGNMLNTYAVFETENLQPASQENIINDKIVVFHNGRGPMCLDFLDFIKTLNYPVEQHLVGEGNFNYSLSGYIDKYDKSEGVSNNFGYYPIIFIKEKAYSGFNEDIKNRIIEDIK